MTRIRIGKKRSFNYLIGLSLCLFSLVACTKPDEKFIGHYTGKLELMPSMEKRLAKLPAEQGAQVRANVANLTAELDLQKDKTYAMTMTSPRGKLSITGTWVYSVNTIDLINKTITKDGRTEQLRGDSADILSPTGDPRVLKMGAANNPALQGLMITFTKSS